MARRLRPPEPDPTGLPVLPAEFRHRPAAGATLRDYIEWRDRRREWFRANGLLTARSTLDWRLVDRGPRDVPEVRVMGAGDTPR